MRLVCIVVAFLVLAGCVSPTTIRITDTAPWYDPAVLEIKSGDTVVFDAGMAAVVHPVSTLGGPEYLHSGHFTATWNHTFTEPGVYHYFCPIHPYMQGFIGVDTQVDTSLLPSRLKQWPPVSANAPLPGDIPSTPGVGEIWLDAQFQLPPGKEKPGVIYVIDATNWSVKRVINDKRLNNPHNIWLGVGGDHLLQTNWFDKYLTVIDRYTGLILKHIYVGESPAHVMTAHGNIYVTPQGEDGLAVLDGVTFQTLRTLKTVDSGENATRGKGPHGHMMSKDMRRMAIANTEGGSIAVWDLMSETKIFDAPTDPLPLMAGLNHDGTIAWTASLLTGKFSAFNVETGNTIKEFTVGSAPVQPVISPDGAHLLVALSGDGAVAILNSTTFDIIKTLPTGAGSHGIAYGPKPAGGWYAYISNKFVPWIAVVDMDSLEVTGYVPLPRDALGGQGIYAVYD